MASQKKLFTREEVKKDNSTGKNLIIIHDKIYDVGAFLNEHPGGEEVLAEQRGKDGSEAFDDVGHSSDAKEMMNQYVVGELVEEEKSRTKPKEVNWSTQKPSETKATEEGGLPYGLIFGIIAALVGVSVFLGLFPS